MRSKLANLIKTRRKALNLSQKELAEGICTQTIISRLEKSEVNPSVDIFFKIVKKLNISMEEVAELFDVELSSNIPFISNEVKDLLYKRDDKTLDLLLKTIDFNKLTSDEKLFYESISATLVYYLDNDLDLSIKKLNTILEQVEKGSLLYCRIIATLANFYTEKKDFPTAVKYFESILCYLPSLEDSDFEQYFYYGIARAYGMNNQIDEGMQWNSLAISKLLEKKSFFKLGDNYYLQARLFEEKKFYSYALESCNKAINIYQIENNEIMRSKVLSYLSYLKEKTLDEKN